MKVLQEQEVFEKVKGVLSQVAPDKVKNGITLESSFAKDLCFESLEIINMMMQVENTFFSDNSKPIDESKLVRPIETVGDLCKFVVDISKD